MVDQDPAASEARTSEKEGRWTSHDQCACDPARPGSQQGDIRKRVSVSDRMGSDVGGDPQLRPSFPISTWVTNDQKNRVTETLGLYKMLPREESRSSKLGSLRVQKSVFFFFWPHRVAWGILVPRPGIEPICPAVEVQSPKHETAREFPPD